MMTMSIDVAALWIGRGVLSVTAVIAALLATGAAIGLARSVSLHLWAIFYVRIVERPVGLRKLLSSLTCDTFELAFVRRPDPLKAFDPETGTIRGVWSGTFGWSKATSQPDS